jgi:hypothetical protein
MVAKDHPARSKEEAASHLREQSSFTALNMCRIQCKRGWADPSLIQINRKVDRDRDAGNDVQCSEIVSRTQRTTSCLISTFERDRMAMSTILERNFDES